MAKKMKLNEITTDNLHLLSLPAKLLLSFLVAALIVVLAYFLSYSGQLSDIRSLENEETRLQDTFKDKSIKAAGLETLKTELEQIRESFVVLLRQLPSQAEVEGLLQELNQAGTNNNIRISNFVTKPPVDEGVVQRIPYDISFVGNFKQISHFARDVGGLSRIVTIDSISIKPDKESGNLMFSAVANTYKAGGVVPAQNGAAGSASK